jgi:hypothetical protein
MADHRVKFDDSFSGFILREDEIRDLVDLFYRWDDGCFIFRCDEKERKFRGEHRYDLGGGHTITLVRKNILRDYESGKSVGGNMVAPTLRVAAGMVLAHELQHANQSKQHTRTEGFFKDHRYWNRACERDARAFVDEHLNEICAYFAVVPPMRSTVVDGVVGQDEVLAVADLLGECSDVTMEDIKDELRISKALNPKNVALVLERLRSQGFEIRRREDVQRDPTVVL